MRCAATPREGTVCTTDYPGDDAYWADDLFGVGGPQRSVIYEDYPEMGEVAFSCVWTARGVIELDGTVQWFKPERLTSGRRDATQLFAGAGEDVAFAVVWQEDPKGLVPGEGDGPGDGWSGSNTNNKTDIWYSYITLRRLRQDRLRLPRGRFGRQRRHRRHRSRAGRAGQGAGADVPAGEDHRQRRLQRREHRPRRRQRRARLRRGGPGHPPLLRHPRRHRHAPSSREPTRSAPTPSRRPTPTARSTTSA